MNLPLLKDAKVEGKRVLLALDLDVPLSASKKIVDDTRLRVGMDSLKYLLHRKATIVIVGKLGRPKGKDKDLSLKPVINWLCDYLDRTAKEAKIGDFEGWQLGEDLFVLENIRFYKEEKDNDPAFAKKLASLASLYVNDAFANAHRDYASITGVAHLLPHYAGLRLELELRELSEALNNPKRPLCLIIGGAKIETKLPLVDKMHEFADYVLVGGKIAEETKQLLEVQHEKIKRRAALLIADLNENRTDITDNSVENFIQIIKMCKSVIWNGPLGIIENSEYKTQEARASEADGGTQKIAEAIIKYKLYSIVGGGDTLGFLKENNLLDSFNFTSTGGGAMLAYLSGEKLPGVEALLK